MRIIEFEGIDGSGKSTALKFFVQQLKSLGYRVLESREVGSPLIEACVKLREVILNPTYNMNGKAMEYVFAAMRIENQAFYDSVKDDYDFLVSDRGFLSHLAYTDHNVNPEFTEKFYVNGLGTETKLPDQVIYLEVSPDVAFSRRVRRGEEADAIELKGPEFQEKVADSFLKYIDLYQSNTGGPVINRVDFIDANQDVESVENQLLSVINTLKFDVGSLNESNTQGANTVQSSS